MFAQIRQLNIVFLIILYNKSMSEVFRVNCQEEARGKKFAQSKKMFQWNFYIRNAKYRLKLISSAVSGKKSISLNGTQIYSQQHLFNTSFVFNHQIQGHNVRIDKSEQGVNNFTLRIDNQQFDQLPPYLQTYKNKVQKKIQTNIIKEQIDPFADFGSFSNTNSSTNNNIFGEFSLDSFSSNVKKQPVQQVQFFSPSSKKQKPRRSEFQENLLDINTNACSREVNMYANNFAEFQLEIQQNDIFSTNSLKNRTTSNDLLMDQQSYDYNPQANQKSQPNFIRNKINQFMEGDSLI